MIEGVLAVALAFAVWWITIRATTGKWPDCPGFDMRGSWDGKARLRGTWLVVRNANAITFPQ